MKRSTRLLTAVSLILLLAAPAVIATGTVTGHFQHNDERSDLRHGIAVHWPDPDLPGERIVFVLLADTAPDAERGRGKNNPVGNIEAALPYDSHYLSLYLSEEGPAPTVHRIASSTGLVALSPGGDALRIENGRITGTYVATDVRHGSSRWQVDLRFDLPLVDLGMD